ncbi:MAG: TonB C-terminal domain-containing protein [Gemmatimonadetes bacterium]|jgi:hypothetical protein|nr:TonB C-terminal domain-containing protein [Gemmatimonadota bacterium]MBK8061873.1 TonB C-terminal domain-containing protein [Gemmatimonadota bacterium]MBK9978638.1 TonB C-terminal domain-containing protein [Gemmatimonadota bacterium]
MGLPATVSLVLHLSLVVLAVVVARDKPLALPPVYQVDLIAAPPGPRAIGQVSEQAAAPAAETPPPKRAEAPDETPVPMKKAPRKPAPVKSTPVPNAKPGQTRNTPAPKAGGGAEGGRGTDVANVSVQGIPFPYPGYLENIVRQIALRFKPRAGQTLVAEVLFFIRRDGSMNGFQFRRRSGSYEFDLEAQGAVEAAARSGAFGPLPDGFRDDVLTVIFSFDPQLIR